MLLYLDHMFSDTPNTVSTHGVLYYFYWCIFEIFSHICLYNMNNSMLHKSCIFYFSSFITLGRTPTVIVTRRVKAEILDLFHMIRIKHSASRQSIVYLQIFHKDAFQTKENHFYLWYDNDSYCQYKIHSSHLEGNKQLLWRHFE